MYDKTHNQYISKDDPNIKISVGSNIRYKIDQIKYDKNEFVSDAIHDSINYILPIIKRNNFYFK